MTRKREIRAIEMERVAANGSHLKSLWVGGQWKRFCGYQNTAECSAISRSIWGYRFNAVDYIVMMASRLSRVPPPPQINRLRLVHSHFQCWNLLLAHYRWIEKETRIIAFVHQSFVHITREKACTETERVLETEWERKREKVNPATLFPFFSTVSLWSFLVC